MFLRKKHENVTFTGTTSHLQRMVVSVQGCVQMQGKWSLSPTTVWLWSGTWLRCDEVWWGVMVPLRGPSMCQEEVNSDHWRRTSSVGTSPEHMLQWGHGRTMQWLQKQQAALLSCAQTITLQMCQIPGIFFDAKECFHFHHQPVRMMKDSVSHTATVVFEGNFICSFPVLFYTLCPLTWPLTLAHPHNTANQLLLTLRTDHFFPPKEEHILKTLPQNHRLIIDSWSNVHEQETDQSPLVKWSDNMCWSQVALLLVTHSCLWSMWNRCSVDHFLVPNNCKWEWAAARWTTWDHNLSRISAFPHFTIQWL